MSIIITQRQSKNQYGEWIDSLENSYVKYLNSFDTLTIPITNSVDRIEFFLEQIDFKGIILSGGGDVDPGLYGQVPSGELNISPRRDIIESKLLDFAIKKKKPVLGLCRGMQLINVYFGGKLIQDLKKIDIEGKHKPPCIHSIKINNSVLSKKFGREIFEINSYHNQAIIEDNLAQDLECFAVAEDFPIIEGFFHRKYPIVGIQWHPERLNSDKELDRFLIKSFLNGDLFWK